MKFWNFGKTLLIAALSAGVIFGFTSCTQSFTAGYIFITGTVTANSGDNGIISGYKIDNNTGKLTQIHGLPIGSGGSNPSRAVLISGGRFIYVLNQGINANGETCDTETSSESQSLPCSGANITLFTVGGGGVLTPEGTYYTQGINPYRLVADSSGSFLFALEKSVPTGSDGTAACQSVTQNNYCGSVSVFAINTSNGRLSTMLNKQLTAQSSGNYLTYYPVPENPVDFTFASGYLVTISSPSYSTGQMVLPYQYTSSTGQLTKTAYGYYPLTNGDGAALKATTNLVYANSRLYVLDNESVTPTGSTVTYPSQIMPYTVSGGALVAAVGGPVGIDTEVSNPVNLIIPAGSSSNKFLYVINDSCGDPTDTSVCATQPASGIVGFVIDPSTSQLTENTYGGTSAVIGTGAQPQCIVQDPTNQYIYTAGGGKTVDGRVISPITGTLTYLRGKATSSSWTLEGPATWCIVSGRTS